MDPTRGDPRYNLNYSMGLSLADQADLYGNPGVGLSSSGGGGGGGRPPSVGLIQSMGGGGRSTSSSGLMGHGGSSGSGQCQTLGGGGGGGQARGIKRTSSDCYDDHHRAGINSQQLQGLDGCGGNGNNGGNPSGTGGGQTSGNIIDVVDDNNYNTTTLQNKKSPPANGKKTKGRVKIKMEYIDNKLRRYTTFSKRKTGIMKKAYELSTLTGTQVMLLVASETGHVYTFATRKLQPMITSEAGKQLIQTCLNSPDPPTGGSGGDQRMSATGFEETELSYNIADEDSKDDRSPMSSINDSDESSDIDSPGPPPSLNNSQNILPESTILEHPNSLNLHSSQIQVTNPTSSSSTSSSHYDAMKTTSTLAHLSGIGNVLYPPSALANIPQEVLLGLVQSGHLQLHTEEDGGHQFITIPLSMTSTATGGNSRNSNNSSTSSTNTVSGGNGGLQTSQIGTSNNGGSSSNKNHKDLSIKVNPSSSVLTANGRESSPIEIIRIKKEIIE